MDKLKRYKWVILTALSLVILGSIFYWYKIISPINNSAQISDTVDKVNKKSNEVVSVSDTMEKKYQILNNQLVKSLLDGKYEVLVEDVTSAGFKSALSQENCAYEGLSFYGDFGNKLVFFESCSYGEGGTTKLWAFDWSINKFRKMLINFGETGRADSFDLRFRVGLGETDSDGEIRKLHVVDLQKEKEYHTNQLPPGLSYLEAYSGLNGMPVGDMTLDGGYLTVKVFSTVAPASLLNDRMDAKRLPVFEFTPNLYES